MTRFSDTEFERLLRNNPDVSTDYPTQVPKTGNPITPKIKGTETDRVNAYPERRNKYGNRKVAVDGITFDSQREYRRYLELRDAQASGQIDGLVLQPRFTLLEGWQAADGTKYRRIDYLGDFSYLQDGKTVVEDVKSKPTRLNPVYRLKIKLLLYQHKDDPQFVFREVT